MLQNPQRPCHNLKWSNVSTSCSKAILSSLNRTQEAYNVALAMWAGHISDPLEVDNFVSWWYIQECFLQPASNLAIQHNCSISCFNSHACSCRYDRQCIEHWLAHGNSVCPVTSQQLQEPVTIVSNVVQRTEIEEWCKQRLPHALVSCFLALTEHRISLMNTPMHITKRKVKHCRLKQLLTLLCNARAEHVHLAHVILRGNSSDFSPSIAFIPSCYSREPESTCRIRGDECKLHRPILLLQPSSG